METDSLSPSLAPRIGLLTSSLRHRCVRHKMNMVLYVNLDQGNGGIISDLSEYGVAVQAVAPLRIHQHVLLRFDLPHARSRVEVVGQVVWATTSGKAGIQFTQITHRTRRMLKDWLLTNLLITASHLSGSSGILAESPHVTECSELTFSAAPRPAIRLDNISTPEKQPAATTPLPIPTDRSAERNHPADLDPLHEQWLEFSWWPVPIATRTFSAAVDALVLLVSLVLFCVVFLAISRQVPSWPATVLTALGVLLVFTFVYRFLFVGYSSGTPGFRLALLAADKAQPESLSQQELTRFR